MPSVDRPRRSPAARTRRLAHVHAVAKSAGIEGDDYRTWLRKRTGMESCGDLDDEALAKLSDGLKATPAQWRMVCGLAREIWPDGIENEGFRTFSKRVTKADDPRTLSKPQVRNLIAGLKRWVEYLRAKGRTVKVQA